MPDESDDILKTWATEALQKFYHIEQELERLNKSYDNLLMKVENIRSDIAVLKIKAGIWGAVGAMIPVVGAILFIVLRG